MKGANVFKELTSGGAVSGAVQMNATSLPGDGMSSGS